MALSFRRSNPEDVDFSVLFIAAILSIALHLTCVWRYGYFRDELYYLACCDRPALGYVDHPPLCVWLLTAWIAVLGKSLLSIRLLSIGEGALNIIIVGAIAARLGGTRKSQSIAGFAVLLAPVYRVVCHLYSMNALDVLLWSICIYCVIASFQENPKFYWCLAGFFLGLALLNKLSAVWLCGALIFGLLLTEDRQVFRTWPPYFAFVFAAVLSSPYLVWQIENGWPTLEFVRNANSGKLSVVGPIQFVLTQWVVMNPFTSIIWLVGIWAAWRNRETRFLSTAFLFVVAILVVNGHSRENYLSPAYALVIPVGAVWIERNWLSASRRGSNRIGWAMMLLAGAVLPFCLPILPVKTLLEIAAALPKPPSAEKGLKSPIQGFADMFGWKEQVYGAYAAFRSLPESDRRKVAIFTQNYGEAAAIDLIGKPMGMPGAISGHNAYASWGWNHWDGSVAILIGHIPPSINSLFETEQVVPYRASELATPEERSAPIFIARRLHCTVPRFWSLVKHYE